MLPTTGASRNVRLDIKLWKSNDIFYNEIYYFDFEKSNSNRNETSNSATIRFYDEYVDDTFIDDSELFADTIPFGMDTEHKGFYINKGPLILKQAECKTAVTDGN